MPLLDKETYNQLQKLASIDDNLFRHLKTVYTGSIDDMFVKALRAKGLKGSIQKMMRDWDKNVLGLVGSTITTTQASSVTDPITGHTYSFVAADGTTPEQRTVFQYALGSYGVLGGTNNPVRIGSITPVSTSVSTSAYTRPNNIDDAGTVGAQTRWMHGTMVNPWQGVSTPASSGTGFDNYVPNGEQAPNMAYQHSLNQDPGATGVPLVLEEGSVVKSESFTEEGGHTLTDEDRTRLVAFSCLTVVPELPAPNSFRPPIRGTDKRSYWTTDQMDIPASRRAIAGGLIPNLDAWNASNITGGALTRFQAIQQTFMPYQAPARRFNPGARSVKGGVLIYGNDWYFEWSKFFATFYSAQITDAEVEGITHAVVQAGIDIYGLLTDNSYYFAWQAHHAGRKGICFASGLLLNDQDILDQCDADLHPEHFGVDDAYTGYITQDMIDSTPGFVKGQYQYRWPQEMLGLADWSYTFTQSGLDPETSDQIQDASIRTRSYQVLSFDGGAMYQCLWGMLSDPTAQYYKPAYFDFADRYLAYRFGDQIHGEFDVSGDATSTNGVHGINGGNWWSINPSDADVLNFQRMRNACPRPNYVLSMIPEAMPQPTVTHDGTSGHLLVNFNPNNIRLPRNAEVPITQYDLRYIAYVGDADKLSANGGPSGESSPNYIGRFEWKEINNITLPYQLTEVPRGERVLIQLRMRNANGAGPYLDDRRTSSYPDNQPGSFTALAQNPIHATRFVVPDLAAFNKVSQNFKIPSASPAVGVETGGVLTGDDGFWSENPAIISTDRQWQRSTDGGTTWADISGATSQTYTTVSADEGNVLRYGVRKTNSVGTSAWIYSTTEVPVTEPNIVVHTAQVHGNGVYSPGAGALGGKRVILQFACRANNPVGLGGSIGAYNFGASEVVYQRNSTTTSTERERHVTYILDIPPGETAETINYNDTNAIAGTQTSGMYEVTDGTNYGFSGVTGSDSPQSLPFVSGDLALWFARSDGTVDFTSSSVMVQHKDAPTGNSSWDAAHAFVVPDGNISVTFARAFASNTRAILLRLRPV